MQEEEDDLTVQETQDAKDHQQSNMSLEKSDFDDELV